MKTTQNNMSSFPEGGTIEAPQVTLLQASWRLFQQNRLAVAGLAVFIVFFIIAVAGVFLTTGLDPYFNPSLVRLQDKLLPPLSSPALDTLSPDEVPRLGMYLLGTDDLGRDVFARMLQGAWVSLTVGFVAVGIAVVIGIFLGGIAGYYGARNIGLAHLLIATALGVGAGYLFYGRIWPGLLLLVLGVSGIVRLRMKKGGILKTPVLSVDGLITGLIDIMLCFPSFFLILTVVALLPPSIYNIMAVIGLTGWMGSARFIRAEFLSLREQDFITAARALGVSDWRIIYRHLVPNALAPVFVSSTIGIASAILTESALSFLGFGVPPPHATWGNILSDGKNFLFDAPWLTFIPGFAILIVVLAFNLFGEGLRDALNPKLRER